MRCGGGSLEHWNNVDCGDREYSGGVGGMIIIMRLLGRSVGRGLYHSCQMEIARFLNCTHFALRA